MTQTLPTSLRSIRGIMGCCHLLLDGERTVMIDAGLVGERFQIARALKRAGLSTRSISAVLLTHGHLDHTGNLRWIVDESGAKVYAHPLEQEHIEGRYGYTGLSRWCGRLEAVGRALIGYRSTGIDVPLRDGDELPFWGGLRVIHLPGHTAGHCGFYSATHDILFSGDMFASYFFNVHRPPAILNSRPELLASSFRKMSELGARYIVPSHYDFLDGELHRRRFESRVGGWSA